MKYFWKISFIIFLICIFLYSCWNFESDITDLNFKTNSNINIILISPTNGQSIENTIELFFNIEHNTNILSVEIKFGDDIFLKMDKLDQYWYYDYPAKRYFSLSNKLITVKVIDVLSNFNTKTYFFSYSLSNYINFTNYILSNTNYFSNILEVNNKIVSNFIIFLSSTNIYYFENNIKLPEKINDLSFYFNTNLLYFVNNISTNFHYDIFLSTNKNDYFLINNSFYILLTNSTNSINLFLKDNFGNYSFTNNIYFIYDFIPPFIYFLNYTNNNILTNRNKISINFSINDDLSGLRLLRISIFNLTNTNDYNIEFSELNNTNLNFLINLEEGTNIINFLLFDNSLNSFEKNFIAILDSNSPYINFNSYSLFTNINSLTISGYSKDSKIYDSGIKEVYLSINSENFTKIYNSTLYEKIKFWSYNIVLTNVTNIIKCFAIDAAGNFSFTNEKIIIIDKEKPVINIYYPYNNLSISNDILELFGSIYDNGIGSGKIYVSLNNKEFNQVYIFSNLINTNWKFLLKLDYGSNLISIYSKDDVGNFSDTNSLYIYNYGTIFLPQSIINPNKILLMFKLDYLPENIGIYPFIYGNFSNFIDNGLDYIDITNGGININLNGSHNLEFDKNTGYYYKYINIPDNSNYIIEFILLNYDTNKFSKLKENFWENIGGQCIKFGNEKYLVTNKFQKLYISNYIITGIELLNDNFIISENIITNGVLINKDRKCIIIDLEKNGGSKINTDLKTMEVINLTIIWTNVPDERLIYSENQLNSIWKINEEKYKIIITGEETNSYPIITGDKYWMHNIDCVYKPNFGKKLNKINNRCYKIDIEIPKDSIRECEVIFGNSIGWNSGEETEFHKIFLPLAGFITNIFYFNY